MNYITEFFTFQPAFIHPKYSQKQHTIRTLFLNFTQPNSKMSNIAANIPKLEIEYNKLTKANYFVEIC